MESKSSKTRRLFFGKNDPNRILLDSVFPGNDVSFASPTHETGKHHRIVVEGNREHLDILLDHLEELVAYKPSEKYFGEWVLVVPDDITGGLVLFYDPADLPVNSFELLEFVLRRHLIKVCDLRLAQFSLLTATWADLEIAIRPPRRQQIFKNEILAVPLPEGIGNGTIELPLIIAPPPPTN